MIPRIILAFAMVFTIVLCLLPGEATCKGGKGGSRSRSRSGGGGGEGSLSPFLTFFFICLGVGTVCCLFVTCCWLCVGSESTTMRSTSQPEPTATQTETSVCPNEYSESQPLTYRRTSDRAVGQFQRQTIGQRGDWRNNSMQMEVFRDNTDIQTGNDSCPSQPAANDNCAEQDPPTFQYAPPPTYDEVLKNPIYNKENYTKS